MSRPGSACGLSGGGSAAKAAQIFRTMDNDNNGALDFSEMLQALKELGALDGFQASEITGFLQREVREADADHNGLIDLHEFQNYFQKLARMQQNEARLHKLRSIRKNIPSGMEKSSALRAAFRSYCQHGKAHIIGAGLATNVPLEALRMNARQLLRLCKDVGMLQPGLLDAMTVDVVFAQCKILGDRHIHFKGFLEALSMMADSAGSTFEHLAGLIVEHQGSVPETDESPLKATVKRQPSRPLSASQTFRRPKTSDATLKLSRSLNRPVDHEDARTPRNNGHDSKADRSSLDALLSEARAKGASDASKAWLEDKRAMQLHIEELQDVISHLQHDGQDTGPAHRGNDSDLGVRSLSSSLRSEVEAAKAEMRTELRQQIDSIERKWEGHHETLSRDVTTLNKLRLQLLQLEEVVEHMSGTQASFAAGTSSSVETLPAADLEEAVQALEERSKERQSRLEAALLQIATKVDALERGLKG